MKNRYKIVHRNHFYYIYDLAKENFVDNYQFSFRWLAEKYVDLLEKGETKC